MQARASNWLTVPAATARRRAGVPVGSLNNAGAGAAAGTPAPEEIETAQEYLHQIEMACGRGVPKPQRLR
jgi:hypothetical protein